VIPAIVAHLEDHACICAISDPNTAGRATPNDIGSGIIEPQAITGIRTSNPCVELTPIRRDRLPNNCLRCRLIGEGTCITKSRVRTQASQKVGISLSDMALQRVTYTTTATNALPVLQPASASRPWGIKSAPKLQNISSQQFDPFV